MKNLIISCTLVGMIAGMGGKVLAAQGNGNDFFSNRLSGSFNTTPLGRTNTGFVNLSNEDEVEKFNEDQKIKEFSCAQNKQDCVKVDRVKRPEHKYDIKKEILAK